ncbi:MAG: GNAT family N-acetyltransferase [Candidatus Lernaella stagnicola]|nr:GNAT family N-acetyltransferase [Candidatus Lernaella stagnicola]
MTPALRFRWGYYQNPAGRLRLNEFVREVFGLDFAPWNELGYDFAEYTPFSFFADRHVAANVSASPMQLVVNGNERRAVQIGTVATRPDLRRRGLAHSLIDEAHAHWDRRCDLFFLFANESTADFYQQFGYRLVPETRFRTPNPAGMSPRPAFVTSNSTSRPTGWTSPMRSKFMRMIRCFLSAAPFPSKTKPFVSPPQPKRSNANPYQSGVV